MDAYLRETGIEMETYSYNGTKVVTREYDRLVRAVLVAYATREGRPGRT
jgi:hypothetical protein